MSLIVRQLPGILLLTCVCLLTSGCKYVWGDAHTYLTVSHPSSGQDVHLKIQVMTPPEGAATLGNGRYPGLIFVHGGGWGSGSRFDNGFDTEIKTASERGYVAATIDYRLASKDASGNPVFPWPAQIQDLKCAVRWLKSRSAAFNLDPDSITVMGVSAGGHLAAMAAETPGRLDLEAPECPHDGSSDVAHAVVFSGVVDVETTWNLSGMVASQLLGLTGIKASTQRTFGELAVPVQDALLAADPVSAIGQSVSPVLLVHPRNDFLVPVGNARVYFQTLVEQGRPVCLLTLDRGGHFTGPDGADASRFARQQMYAWLDQQRNGSNGNALCEPSTDVEFALTVPY